MLVGALPENRGGVEWLLSERLVVQDAVQVQVQMQVQVRGWQSKESDPTGQSTVQPHLYRQHWLLAGSRHHLRLHLTSPSRHSRGASCDGQPPGQPHTLLGGCGCSRVSRACLQRLLLHLLQNGSGPMAQVLQTGKY